MGQSHKTRVDKKDEAVDRPSPLVDEATRKSLLDKLGKLKKASVWDAVSLAEDIAHTTEQLRKANAG